MSLAAHQDIQYSAVVVNDRVTTVARDSWSTLRGFDILRSRITEIEYGEERYPLWKTVSGRLLPEPAAPKKYRFQLDGLWAVAGEGDTPKAALESFRERFHIRFQELVAKRPFEMNEDEKSDWNQLRQVANVELYRHRLPVLLRQFGEIASREPSISVDWEGTGRESVHLDAFPGEFASYSLGQPFEAFVERDQQTMKIKKVYQVKRRSRPAHYSLDDNEQFSKSLKSNKELPVTNLD